MTVPYPTLPQPPMKGQGTLLRAVPHFARRLLISLLVIVLCAPVLLLLAGTMVPWYLIVLLLGADCILIWLMRGASAQGFFMLLAGLAIVAAGAVWLSQVHASTPAIPAASGEPSPRSIAVLEQVNLGDSKQWITIRGEDIDNPVLIYLGIGGPGAGGFPANKLALSELERHFVVVNWDQPGTGKSYDAVPISSLTVARFVEDARALTELMRARFDEEKVYVLGLSWGTIVGIQLVQQYPELFHAYVGNGQMVNTTENDRIGYEFAVQYADDHNELAVANRLRRNGPPPYEGRGMAAKYAAYNNVLFRYMDSPTLELILLLVPHFSPEYGLIDRVNFARGLIDGFPVVYPQLRDLDFTQQARRLEVPVFFMVGKHDINAVASLVERYYDVLDAPHKELIWLEGGHGATPQQFADVFVNHVLAYTQAEMD